MNEPQHHEHADPVFAPPGGGRPVPPAPPAPVAPDAWRPSDGAASPYAPPPAAALPPAGATVPPYGTAPGYGPPPGYAAAPGYGPPGYAAAPGYGAGLPYGHLPPAQASTDSLAIASLVTSVAGLLFLAGLPGPVGLGLGIGALRRIRRSGARGRGMAVAGIVTGLLSTLVCVGMVWLAVASLSESDAVDDLAYESFGGEPPFVDELPDYTLRTDLAVGDCLRQYPESFDLGTADPVDCAEPHALEVVSVLALTGPVDTYAEPADDGYDRAFADCTADIEATAPGLVDEWVVWTDVSFPHPDDWASGATTAYCAVATDETLRGSVLDGSVTGPDPGVDVPDGQDTAAEQVRRTASSGSADG